MTPVPAPPPAATVDLLILGAGWTSTFLIPLCRTRTVSYAATTRSGRDDTFPFDFDPADPDPDPAAFAALPDARSVLITFPIKTAGASTRLVRLFQQTHPHTDAVFIQLGSTGIWDGGPTAQDPTSDVWMDRHAPFDTTNARAAAESELLALSPHTARATVLNLCGLWGGERQTRHWVGRVAPTKAALKAKGSIHMIHGTDVSRAILAVHAHPDRAAGQRWLLTDLRVYDWWDLASAWGAAPASELAGYSGDYTGAAAVLPVVETAAVVAVDAGGEDRGPQPAWVRELMAEEGVRGLPRAPEHLGRALDSREFWSTFGLEPVRARLE